MSLGPGLVVEAEHAGHRLEVRREERLYRIEVHAIGGGAGIGVRDSIGADGVTADGQVLVHADVGVGNQGSGERERRGEFGAMVHW